ncbi:exopolysaccharide biosynthesis protein [Peteryoungia desertarenae]|uniref:Exopolysaccharide biosynthesis protein n=1 Tax=Peteryoungia desertarenae TaxID=1813451 RepID=A0ABX6QIG9_9HYPH|nr:exopolysaccharide biosynthesis protein [Peteryoungia desertarenae]QLF68358.1 exopolysaccharide biosynthesis protein [Peteryoungia desertarenae]
MDTNTGRQGSVDESKPRRRGFRRRPSRGRRLSKILDTLAGDDTRERVSVGDIFAAMGDRAFGALLLIFALPNILPTPPGTSSVLGAPLVFLSAQLMLGRSPWLPRIIAKRSMTRSDFALVVARISPWLARGERMLKPRFSMLVYPPFEYVIGFLCLMLAIILILPIPLGNILPAIAVCLFSFGLLERDGISVLCGCGMFVLSLSVVAGVLLAMIKGVILLLNASLT